MATIQRNLQAKITNKNTNCCKKNNNRILLNQRGKIDDRKDRRKTHFSKTAKGQ
mgnify:CR=1 FL=1